MPFGLTPREVADELSHAREAGWRDPGSPFEVILVAEGLDPLRSPQATVDVLATLADAGATIVNLRLRHESPRECTDQISAAAELARGIRPATALW